MIKFAGLNQLTPGTHQMSWEPHYRRLDSYIHDAMMDGGVSSQDGFKESEEGRKRKEEILALPWRASFIAEDERMVDLVQRNIKEGAYVNDKPTVGDVRTQMARFAGLASAAEYRHLADSDAVGTLTPAQQEKFRLWHEALQGAGFAYAAEYRSLADGDAAGILTPAHQEKVTHLR
jgi:hypothetical protein